ncbi:type VII secretion protein EccB [Carbonactinospora thermoautotrophica]|uniref:type VII secretion protein EccB n=1 Tax=Carbonactinospora thermoautotrophica TaxID=1469144 RepID=UPI00226E85C4|nr:type VII secretion protein EccB [Carbonactinospora thermoautotrophica]MCX9191282.1 type VII secretion protein EccB [Carbonactinospora thermoautotrophica]
MVSRRDQFDAYLFARRRVVAAFLQAEKGGTEEGAPRPLKNFLSSAGLAAVILAGFAFYGALRPSAPPNWNEGKLIISKETGARYVFMGDGKLHPVLNVASARLLTDPNNFDIVVVSQKVIDKKDKGLPVGIVDAPDDVPKQKDLLNSDWTACTYPDPESGNTVPDETGYTEGTGKLTVETLFIGVPTAKDDQLKETDAAVVQTPGASTYWLLANGHRFEIQRNHLNVLEYDGDRVQLVDPAWLETIPLGNPLAPPTVSGAGQAAPADASVPGKLQRVGQIGHVKDSNRYFIVTRNGIQNIKRTTALLLRADQRLAKAYGGRPPEIVEVDAAEISSARTVQHSVPEDSNWPNNITRWVNKRFMNKERHVLCSTFTGRFGEGDTPIVTLAAANALPSVRGQLPQPVAHPTDAAIADQIVVPRGKGALVQAVAQNDVKSGSVYLVTEPGVKYQVSTYPVPVTTGAEQNSGQQQTVADAVARLGFQFKNLRDIPKIPESWTRLLVSGPALEPRMASQEHNPQAAGCATTPDGKNPCAFPGQGGATQDKGNRGDNRQRNGDQGGLPRQ